MPLRLSFLLALLGTLMPKTILLIENDAAFAEEMSGALEAMGYQVRVTADGKDGLELARDLGPDAIVLCVELPKLSGYSICNKLKKDEALRSIPLILTSSEATDEVFDDHKKLKVRAEDYLIKPYVSATLIEKVSALIGPAEGGGGGRQPAADQPPAVGQVADEEVVSLDDELALDSFASEPGQELPTLDLDSLPDEPAAPVESDAEFGDDLKLLDDAFDGLSTPAPRPSTGTASAHASEDAAEADEAIHKALGVDRPVTSEDLEAASASLPEEDEAAARAELGGLEDEGELALGTHRGASAPAATSAFDALDALGDTDEPPSRPVGPGSPSIESLAGIAGTAVATVVAAGAAGLAAGGGAGDLARLEAELTERRAALGAREAALRELRAKLHQAEQALSERTAEVVSLKTRGEAMAAKAKKAEAEARSARDEAQLEADHARAAEARVQAAEEQAGSAEAKLSAAEARCRAAEQDAAAQRRASEQAAAALAATSAELVTAQAAAARLAQVDHEVERLEAELAAARDQAEKPSAESKRRITELEAANAKNEERVVKAYLKIKGDEKVRDKARKALAIALQLLEEGLPSEATGEKRARGPE